MMRILLALFFLLCFSAQGATHKLHLFIWSEYIDPEVVTEFEEKFDCEVIIDLYEDAESMLAKIQGGGAGLYDLVVPSDYTVTALVKQNLLAPLRHENLPNLKNLEKRFLSPPFDPGNKYSVAYQWGTVGIYARKQPGKELPHSWSVLFDPAQQPGSIVLIDSMRDLIGAALKYKGHGLNSTSPEHLKEARDLLIATKKRSAGFAASVGAMNRVLEKSAHAAIVYSGEAGRGMAEDAETFYFVPKEGSQIWVDNLAVLAKAPNRDLAEKFINFVLEPEVGARISNYTQFTTPNAAAKKFIDPELLKNPAIYPPDELLSRLEFLKDLGRDTRMYDQVWTQIKAN